MKLSGSVINSHLYILVYKEIQACTSWYKRVQVKGNSIRSEKGRLDQILLLSGKKSSCFVLKPDRLLLFGYSSIIFYLFRRFPLRSNWLQPQKSKYNSGLPDNLRFPVCFGSQTSLRLPPRRERKNCIVLIFVCRYFEFLPPLSIKS